MLKVENVSFLSAQKVRKNEGKKVSNPQVQAQIAPDKVMKSMNTVNRANISFKGDYYKTLSENYFKLPQGAAPDKFQKAAAANLYKGNDVVVTAPTGTGKTAIAHYVITKNLEEGKRTFYTTPLKALSNEKYRSFQKVYGKENVGLLTGDVKVNAQAPIVIMTTEVYRNMVFANQFKDQKDNKLDNLKTVVFDELHYLGDVDRGGIWEQSIIMTPPETQLLSLSATVGNNKKVADWMASARGQGKAEVAAGNLDHYKAKEKMPTHTVLVDVPPENRHVPLEFENLTVKASEKSGRAAGSRGQKMKAKKMAKAFNASESAQPAIESYGDVVSKLKEKDQLPAIMFIFSKKGSNNVLNYLSTKGESLTTRAEKDAIQDTLDRYKEEGKYLGESLNKNALLNGYAIHNSGLLPTQKELVEELFQKKLLKVCLATETLSAGINMPARTTVISATRKPSSTPDGQDGKRELSANEFHQMAGRAGRRGIDKKGYCYTMNVNTAQKNKFDTLTKSPANSIESSFKPDYSFIAGYYDTCSDDDVIKELFAKSLHAYDENANKSEKNSKELLNVFNEKKARMINFGYINQDNELSTKGKLLTKLNGYEQIPIIDAVNNKRFGGLDPVELAGAVASLANIDNKAGLRPQDKNNEVPFQHESEALTWFVESIDKDLDKFNDSMLGAVPIKQNKDAAKHVSEWASLNDKDENSRENWEYLYTGPLRDSIRDEGSVFKEVTMTVDLLKQMKDIAEVGIDVSEKNSDVQYYKDLQETIGQSIKLLCKEPIVVKEQK